ncbi:amidohydrolase [Acidobacteria bacterium AH-259-D05]|nr:amidohydrolase [Acidobacteria bacterium AH-259-D05]
MKNNKTAHFFSFLFIVLFQLPSISFAQILGKEKEFVVQVVEGNREAIALLGDSIFYFAELGMQEVESSQLMTEILKEAGFEIERGISGMTPAFLATYGSGNPVIAIHTEFDTTPGNSQTPGVTEHTPLVEGAPGHAEGHNVNAAVMIGAAFAIKKALEEFKLEGTLKIFGAPAEEQLISRPYFVRDGYFDDVEIVFHPHIGSDFRTQYGLRQYALISAKFHFKGESAHGATAPWKGRDALDAVELMDLGFDKFREHLEPTQRSHRVITSGGVQPNVIPDQATIWWFFRESTAEKVSLIFERAKEIAQGAALMTGTTYSVEIMSAVWPTRANRTAAEVIQKNIEQVGMPEWSQEEQKLAKELQTKRRVNPVGLVSKVTALGEPSRQGTSANDSGDLTWLVPTGRLTFPSNIPGIAAHHWAAGVAPATSIAHKGAVAGAKVLAASAIDFFTAPNLVAKAKETFREEVADVEFKSLLPEDQKPPLTLNKELMDRFRPLMRKDYLKEKPRFR